MNKDSPQQGNAPSAPDYLLSWLQYLYPQHMVSGIIHRATRCQNPAWKDFLVRHFIRHFQVDMELAVQPDPRAYPDFNSFFTRALRPEARPMDDAGDAILCPVDGTVSQLGQIHGGRIFQAKGRDYTLDELLADSGDAAPTFRDGSFATLYLSPRDYHRIHMPLSGTLRTMIYVPGRLFSVNARTTRVIPRLFARNERVVCLFETNAGPMAMVLVGAINVGSIETVWHGAVTPPYGKDVQTWRYPDSGDDRVALNRGEEMGRFNMGSTVILLFGAGRAAWQDDIGPELPVRMGQRLGTQPA